MGEVEVLRRLSFFFLSSCFVKKKASTQIQSISFPFALSSLRAFALSLSLSLSFSETSPPDDIERAAPKEPAAPSTKRADPISQLEEAQLEPTGD